MATDRKTTTSKAHHPKKTSPQFLKPTITVESESQDSEPSILQAEFDATLDRIIQRDRELLERLA